MTGGRSESLLWALGCVEIQIVHIYGHVQAQEFDLTVVFRRTHFNDFSLYATEVFTSQLLNLILCNHDDDHMRGPMRYDNTRG